MWCQVRPWDFVIYVLPSLPDFIRHHTFTQDRLQNLHVEKYCHLDFADEKMSWEKELEPTVPQFRHTPPILGSSLCLPSASTSSPLRREINLGNPIRMIQLLAEPDTEQKEEGLWNSLGPWEPDLGSFPPSSDSPTEQKRALQSLILPPRSLPEKITIIISLSLSLSLFSLTLTLFSIFLISLQKHPPWQHYLMMGILQFPRLHLIWHDLHFRFVAS